MWDDSAYIDECSLHILAVKQIRRLLSLQPESDLHVSADGFGERGDIPQAQRYWPNHHY